ncbi:MAG TPA: TadE family protein [Dehalococcoidia bacterium]|nr:TadE family protein [Dehalococcoidia bacterium]
MRLLRRLLRKDREDGQATFEFALLIPLFILAVLLVVDGGIWMYKFVTVSNAVRDTARYASVNCGGNTCDIGALETRLEQSSSGFVTCPPPTAPDPPDCQIRWIDRGAGDSGDVDKGDSVIIYVNQKHDLLFFPVSVGVASCAEMRLEAANGESVGSGGC